MQERQHVPEAVIEEDAMSREIRRVPPDWEHPKDGYRFRPLHERSYESALAQWLRARLAWNTDQPVPDWTPKEQWLTRGMILSRYPNMTFESWYGRTPDEKAYRSRVWSPDEATAYQLYETVSEGTPLSPVCATRDDMLRWLTTATTDIQGGERRPMSPEGAEAFMESTWAPTAVESPEHGLEPGLDAMEREAQGG